MGEEFGGGGDAGLLAGQDRLAELQRIPVDDDGGQQIEPSHAVVLTLAGAVTQFAALVEVDGTLQGVVGFSLVQAVLGAPTHGGVGDPVDHEQGAFDAADFAKGSREFVLARIRSELAQDLARAHGPGGHGGRDAQDVGPVPGNQIGIDGSADERAQRLRHAGALEHMEAFRGQVTDARDERVAEDRARREDMVGEAAGVGVLFADATPGLVHQQAIEDVGSLVDGGGDGLRGEWREAVGDVRVCFDPGFGPVAPFYSRPVECTDRDAPFVLDGVLYHESDLDLEEHYTDTHGYTEINFAAFAMIGMRFCPRIRNVHRQRIYCADPTRDHGVLEPVLQRGRRSVNFRLIAEQWERIGQFYAAFPAGHATASAALQRLNRFRASNRFYGANRELGRALKTEFVLQYMSEPTLRTRVRRGLLKVEQLHALARAVYYGQRGRIRAREVYDQMNACSCLTLILACVIYWQAREISRIAAAPDFPFDPELIARISPIEWRNIVLYGEIKIDPSKLSVRGP